MVRVESRIEQVTVYAHGARVRRVATVRAPLPPRIRFVDLPIAVIDDTVRTDITGDAGGVVTSVRVGVDTPDQETRSEESAELRAARRRVAIAESEIDRLRQAIDQVTAAPIVEDDPTDEPPAAWSAVLAARRSLVALRASREQTLREQHAAARRELDDARRAFHVAAERDRDSGSARAARLHEVRKHADLELTGNGDVTIHLEYQVAAARWAPSYVARLGGERASFELRAIVAQDSGEDWTGVALRLSTAEPERFTQLPELLPQKIGRRQQEPAKRGFRAPPVGAAALYGDYEREFPRRVAPIGGISKTEIFDDSTYEGRVPPPPAEVPADFGGEVWDEESSRSKEMYPVPASPVARGGKGGALANAIGGAMSTPFALPAQSIAKKDAGLAAPAAPPPPGGGGRDKHMRGESANAPAKSRGVPMGGDAADAVPIPRLDYGNLRMAPPRSSERGTLVATRQELDGALAGRVSSAIAMVEHLVLPPGHDDDWIHTYDYAYTSDGKVDIASDAAWHSIALTSRAGKATIHHVAVPREQPDVFRVAAIENPFDGPLLPGPIDVYDRGQFLVTSEVDYTPPGGVVDVGLGVDPTVKIARNVEFHEEATGMLRGALRLIHAITIDVENLSPRPINIEVRERIPVVREGDDDVEVTVGKVEPTWERFSPDADSPDAEHLRGGFRWKLAVPASTKKLLRAGYEVKIAGKHELVGGNRREP